MKLILNLWKNPTQFLWALLLWNKLVKNSTNCLNHKEHFFLHNWSMKHTQKSQEELKKKIATADLLLSIFSFEKVKRCTAVLLLTIKSNFKKTSSKYSFKKDKLKHEFSHLKKWNDAQQFYFKKNSSKNSLTIKHEFSHLKKWNDAQRFFLFQLSPTSKIWLP